MPKRAAQYLRVSRAEQHLSLPGQIAIIAAFALEREFEVVRTYLDEGRSGLRLDGRAALQSLLRDVVSGKADYEVVLVQDVSRWGRFQDTDEGAHYEYICRAAGVEIHYCQEPFDHTSELGAALFKAVKRLMAAEFSRELSAKTRRAQRYLAASGFKMGGVAGFGLRRALMASDRTIVRELAAGERKVADDQRVVLVPGPAAERQTVSDIFRMYTQERLGLEAIAEQLNRDERFGEGGRPWGGWTIGQVLSNPKYIGRPAFGRRSRTLDGRRVNSEAVDLVSAHALESIIDAAVFRQAQELRQGRMLFLPRDEAWRRLKAYAAEGGLLTVGALSEAKGLPSPQTLTGHFGHMRQLRARVGVYTEYGCRARIRAEIIPGYKSHHLRYSRLMSDLHSHTHTAFIGDQLVASGSLQDVALAARRAQSDHSPMPIVFDDATGAVIDLDLRGSDLDVIARLPPEAASLPTADAPAGRGRPKLGVVAREVTLLPEHWTWLSSQPGGASAALRRLVSQAAKANAASDRQRGAQNSTYKVMHALAGHLPGYEGALRALFASDRVEFEAAIANWPADFRAYALRLAGPAFNGAG